MKAKKKIQKVKAWGILNSQGDLWTLKLDYTEIGGKEHLREFREQFKMDLRGHKIIPVTVIYEI